MTKTAKDPAAALDAHIAALEAERKRNPPAFHSAHGKPDKSGPKHLEVMDLLGRLEGFTQRLRAIQ